MSHVVVHESFNRRGFAKRLAWAALSSGLLAGCRGTQHATVRDPAKPDMIGSHAAGAETFKPLVEQAVGELLARHSAPCVGPSGEVLPPTPKRVCFIGVENKSAEEIGDFKDQLYQTIDTKILQSQVFQPINKRYIDAGLTLQAAWIVLEKARRLASLDAARKAEILPYLERLRAEKLPMIYVSHQPDEVRRIADHVVRLDGGRVAAAGGVELLG